MGNLDFSANADQLKELAAYMASQINVPTIGIGGGYAPIGSINFFDATTAPQDWLACDGSVYNIADYPQLAEWYATQHGASNFYGGDGTTTFAVPDLQGEFLRGTGTNSHANQGSGANVGVHQDGTEHTTLGTGDGNAFVYSAVPSNGQSHKDTGNKDSVKNLNKGAWQSPGGTSAYDSNVAPDVYTSRPTNTSFLICVKAVVAGEVYSTEERVGGTWIDGKPIYQKTIDCGALPNNTTKNVAHGINNIDKVIDANCMVYIASVSSSIPMPWHSSSEYNNIIIAFISDINTTNIVLKTNGDRTNCTGIATLQYTKTTD